MTTCSSVLHLRIHRSIVASFVCIPKQISPVMVPINLNILSRSFRRWQNDKKFWKHPLNMLSGWRTSIALVRKSRRRRQDNSQRNTTPLGISTSSSTPFQLLLFLPLIPPGKLRLRLDDSYLPFEENKLNFRLGVMFHENRSNVRIVE